MNLLIDPVFRARCAEGARVLSLPELLEILGFDRLESLTGLQPHQEDAFHVFVCYLAAAALARAGSTDPAQPAQFWREQLRALAAGDDRAWGLVAEDPLAPAFMQSPVPSAGDVARYRLAAVAPDGIDVLQVAKNHDVKRERASAAHADEWCYALVSLQTMSGFLGRGNYGVARMNGGFGSRACVSWLESLRWGPRFVREVGVLLAERAKLLADPYPYCANGHVLLWTVPWDGQVSLALGALDPFFIEVARAVRLKCEAGMTVAWSAPTKVRRLLAADAKGNVGDPWIPITERTGGALTVGPAGLTPKLLRELIFADGYAPARMQQIPPGASPGWFHVSVLVRGEGTTEGFHCMRIRVPGPARSALVAPSAPREQLTALSKRALDIAGLLQSRMLAPALSALLGGGPAEGERGGRETADWVERACRPYVRAWGARYFEWLWGTLEATAPLAVERQWFTELQTLALGTLREAQSSAPQRHGRTYRARARAEAIFFGSARRHFAAYLEEYREATA